MIGCHVIFGTYGFWLPNDPRGSWSNFVGSYELYRYGAATKTTERRSLAYQPHDQKLRLAAKSALQRPAVQFNDAQIAAVAEGIGSYIRKSGLPVWACSVLRDHVHLVIGATSMGIKERVVQIKGSATEALVERGLHPFQGEATEGNGVPKCFARGEWKVYLDGPDDVARAIRYAEANPEKEGLKTQRWPFVVDWFATR